MSHKLRKVAGSTLAAAALIGIAAPAQSQAQTIDIAEVCMVTLGERDGNIDLSPIIRIDFATCKMLPSNPNPGPGGDGVDVAEICTITLGDRAGQISLNPILRVDFATCEEADGI